MDSVISAARLYGAGLLVLGTDRYGEVTGHSVAGVAGCLAVALFVCANVLQPALRRPYFRLSAVGSAVSGGAAVFVLLGQWRDPDVYSWIAAPLVIIGLQAALSGYLRAADADRPPVAARLMIELLFGFAFAVGCNTGQDKFTLARATAQMLAILSLVGVFCLATNTSTSLAPVLAMERAMISILIAVISTQHVIADETRAHSPDLFPIGATACVALLLAPISLK